MTKTASDEHAGSRFVLHLAAYLVYLLLVGFVVLAVDPALTGFERHQLPKELAFCAGVLGLLLARALRSSYDRVDLVFIILFGLSLASGLGSSAQDACLRINTITAGLVALGIVLRGFTERERVVAQQVLAAVLVAGAISLLAEAYGLMPHLSRTGFAPGGTLGHRNEAGHALVVGGFILFASLRWDDGLRARRWALLAGLLVLAWATVLTRSRAAWLAGLAGLAVMLLVHSRPVSRAQIRTLSGGLLALSAGIAIAIAVPSRLVWTSAHPYRHSFIRLLETDRGSGAGRLLQWRTSLSLVRESPLFGVGSGQWSVHYPRIASPGDPTIHTGAWSPVSRLLTGDAIGFWVERGAIFVLVALGLLSWMILAQYRASSRSTAAMVGGVVAFAVVSVLDCFTTTALGALIFAHLLPARPLATPSGTTRLPGLGTNLVLSVFLLAGAYRAYERLELERSLRTADVEETTTLALQHPWNLTAKQRIAEYWLGLGDCEKARPWLEALAAQRPYDPKTRGALSGCSEAR